MQDIAANGVRELKRHHTAQCHDHQSRELLCRPAGASIAQMMKAPGWQSNSVRSFLAGSLKKKGHAVSIKLDENGKRRYRVEAPVKA